MASFEYCMNSVLQQMRVWVPHFESYHFMLCVVPFNDWEEVYQKLVQMCANCFKKQTKNPTQTHLLKLWIVSNAKSKNKRLTFSCSLLISDILYLMRVPNVKLKFVFKVSVSVFLLYQSPLGNEGIQPSSNRLTFD